MEKIDMVMEKYIGVDEGSSLAYRMKISPLVKQGWKVVSRGEGMKGDQMVTLEKDGQKRHVHVPATIVGAVKDKIKGEKD